MAQDPVSHPCRSLGLSRRLWEPQQACELGHWPAPMEDRSEVGSGCGEGEAPMVVQARGDGGPEGAVADGGELGWWLGTLEDLMLRVWQEPACPRPAEQNLLCGGVLGRCLCMLHTHV